MNIREMAVRDLNGFIWLKMGGQVAGTGFAQNREFLFCLFPAKPVL
jgi:hypothetical protein